MTEETGTIDKTMIPVSEESRNWAREILAHYRGVQALHTPQVRWVIPGLEDSSFASDRAALDWADDENLKPEDLQTFVVCAECSAIERESHETQGGDGWGYVTSTWPCRTASAMGLE